MSSMPSFPPNPTVEEYLTCERAASERHYYLDGRIVQMAGESPEHADISANLLVLLGSQLHGKPCRARTKDTKVRSGPLPSIPRQTQGLYFYPDIVVICGEPEYQDAFRDVVINPTAVVEVLSPSTESFDRREKFARFRKWNPTLKDYLLVSQDRPEIEHYTRQADGKWSCQWSTEMDESVAVLSIGCALKMADVYDRIKFPEGGA